MAAAASRRRLLALAAAPLALAWRGGHAQTPPARRYAVVSLIGDEIVLVYAAATTGSHLDRNRQHALPDAAGSFDRYALAAAVRAIERHELGATVTALQMGASALYQRPEAMFDGAQLALPDALVTALEQAQATHVVLLSKHRGPASIGLADTRAGVGALRGLGYYIDRSIALRTVEQGLTGIGMLVPYAYVQLTLAEVRSGAILNQRSIAATRVHSVAANPAAIDPWELLNATEKVERLKRLLENRLAQEIPALLSPPSKPT